MNLQKEQDSFDDNNQLSITEQNWMETLYTACKTSDVAMLNEVLDSLSDSQHLSVDQCFSSYANSTFEKEDLAPEKDNSLTLEADNSITLAQANMTKLLSSPLDKSGETLLHVASRGGDKAIILKLLECGADPAIK